MEAKLLSFEHKEVGKVSLTDYIFGLEAREVNYYIRVLVRRSGIKK